MADSTASSRPAASPFSGLLAFTVRALIVIMLIAIAIAALMPDVPRTVKREMQREESRLRLVGLFTTNPYVHLRVSQLREEKGDLAGALQEMELAIGLFELHAPDKQAPARYVSRRDELRKKLAPQK